MEGVAPCGTERKSEEVGRGEGRWSGVQSRAGLSFQVRAMTEVGVRAEELGSGRPPYWHVKIRW